MTQTSENTAGNFVNDLAVLRQEVGKLAATMSQLVQHQANSASAHVAHAVSDVGHKIRDTATDAQTHVRAAGAKIEAGIEHNPLTAVLVAFGVGLAIAIATRSRS